MLSVLYRKLCHIISFSVDWSRIWFWRQAACHNRFFSFLIDEFFFGWLNTFDYSIQFSHATSDRSIATRFVKMTVRTNPKFLLLLSQQQTQLDYVNY